MIYLITGVPGSGKSLYAVSTLVQALMKEVIRQEDGPDISRRLCVDGIPNLLLPHELMAKRPDDLTKIPEGDGVWNWFDWCKPGDLIVCDEVQRHWRPRGMGTKPPAEIAALETHRHKGVDFVLITQNAMLLDQNVRRLVGRHIHVRRLFGSARALVYDWDGCQTDTTRTQGATKTLFSYPKSAYKLYKSSELHTKQRQKIPLFMAFPLVVIGLGAFAGPKAYDAMHGSLTGKGVSRMAIAPAVASSAPSGIPGQGKAAAPSVALAAPAGPPATQPPVILAPSVALVSTRPVALGCIAFKARCVCYDPKGYPMDVSHAECVDSSQQIGKLVPLVTSNPASAAPVPPSVEAAKIGTSGEAAEPRTVPYSTGTRGPLPQTSRGVL